MALNLTRKFRTHLFPGLGCIPQVPGLKLRFTDYTQTLAPTRQTAQLRGKKTEIPLRSAQARAGHLTLKRLRHRRPSLSDTLRIRLSPVWFYWMR